MSSCIGIHIGNSSACVAVNKNGKVSVVANSLGDRLTPCMVTFTPAETLVGFSSKQVSHRYISETVTRFIGLVGAPNQDEKIPATTSNSPGPLIESQHGALAYAIKSNGITKMRTPEYILELLLKDLLKTAISLSGSEVNEVVFTAPIGCSPSYHKALVETATNSGFEVMRIISEPAAAALAYGIGIEKFELSLYNALVFRVGGMTQDATLFSVNNGILSVLGQVSDQCGGDSLTDIIASHFASAFQKQFRTDITSNIKTMNKLKVHAEKCKHILSTMPSANCHIDSLYDGLDFSCSISRSMFEMLASNHLRNLLKPMQELLSRYDSEKSMIKYVILCGGTCNIPRLQQMVAEILPTSKILSSIPSSEVTAIGAATEAGLLIDQDITELEEEDCMLSIAPTNIYLKFDNSSEIVVPERTVLPYTFQKKYHRPENQNQVIVELFINHCYQESENLDMTLGSMALDLQESENEICCELKYGRSGNLSLTCNHLSGSKSITVGV